MELKEPKPKRRRDPELRPPAPLPLIRRGEALKKFSGRYDGFSVVVADRDAMEKMITMGSFGKGTLSRNYPRTLQEKTEIVRKRQLKRREEWGEKFGGGAEKRKVIAVPDSGSDCEGYFKDLKPEYAFDASKLKESVHLMPEEAYYLQTPVGALDVWQGEKLLDGLEAWKIFSKADKYFVQNYIAYHHFRSKNWVVKPGIKFGGDFLLYKEGPHFYHASYVVIIEIINADTLKRDTDLSRRPMKMSSLLGLNRLCETAGKELLIFQIFWPPNASISYEIVSQMTVKEVLMRRFSAASTQKETTQDPDDSP